MKTKNILSKFLSAFTIITLFTFLIGPSFANAASLTAVSDTMTRQAVSVGSLHIIQFTSTSAIPAGGTIAIAFPSSFTTTGMVITDLQVCHGTTGLNNGTPTITGGTACTASTETISASAGASTQWGAVISGTTTITLTAPTGSMTYPIIATNKVTVEIAATHMINPSSVITPTTTITNSNGDTGSFIVPILDSDQVGVTATVGQSFSFSIKANTSDTGSQPYSVPLGTLTTAAASGSNGSINSIWANLSSNATGGMIVTVVSANGALKSTSTPADTIPSSTGTMTAGSAGYGLCIKSVTQTSGATLTKSAPFNGGTCTYTPTGNTVGVVSTTAAPILTASSLINGGVSEILLDAENTATTPAHTDYADTLTFIGTGTF